MSNPGDRWRRGWIVPLVIGIGALVLVFAKLANDADSGLRTAGPLEGADTTLVASDGGAAADDTDIEKAPFSIERDGDRVVLSGVVASEADREALFDAAVKRYGAQNVVDQLEVAATPDGAHAVSDATALIAAFDQLGPPSSFRRNANGTVTVSGTIPDDAARRAALDAMTKAVGDDIEVEDQLTLAEATPAVTDVPIPTVTPETSPTSLVPTPSSSVPADGVSETTITTTAEQREAITEIQQQVALEGVTFESGSARLTTTANTTLQNVAKVLTDNPAIKIDVNGHTDNAGNPAANQILSKARADAVVAFLAQAGIEPGRMNANGFGDTQPIADNTTASGRATNRRIEFKIQGT